MSEYLTGSVLKDERIRLNLSVEDISRHTYIRGTFISAIENNQIAEFPSLAVTKGFIRNYAFALGLDGDRLLRQFNRELSTGKIKVSGLDETEQNRDAHKPLVQCTEIIDQKRIHSGRRHFTAAEWSIILILGLIVLAVWVWVVYL
ncbi:MAG: helix-turn-helix domain-containing protein [Dialister sp.]|nr:helix-turn-helix domain-containing protein [Dialister sp.]